MDKVTKDRVSLLHPLIRDEVASLIQKAEGEISPHLSIRIVQGLRTFAEQDALYQKGRTKPGKKVTNAPAGASYHNYGLAIDFAFFTDKNEISWDTNKDWDNDTVADWMEVVQIFVRAGYTWGGSFKSIKDMPHLEKTFNLNWTDMKKKYLKKDFIKGTTYINI